MLRISRRGSYLFTGRAYDAETALYYYRARYYDYFTGRFLQPDPTGYTDGLNLYVYVGNSPINRLDPLGLFTIHAGATGSAAFGWAGTVSQGYVIDGRGFGIYKTGGIGAGSPCASIGGSVGVTSAQAMENLQGIGNQTGGTVGPLTAEAIIGQGYGGVEFTAGPAATPPTPVGPVEMHSIMTNTKVERLFDYSDILNNPGKVLLGLLQAHYLYKDPALSEGFARLRRALYDNGSKECPPTD